MKTIIALILLASLSAHAQWVDPHNKLNDLQGGTSPNQYYHLSASDYTSITNGSLGVSSVWTDNGDGTISYTGGVTMAESGGLVGIGTDAPDAKLDLVSDGNTTGTTGFQISNSDGTTLYYINDYGNAYYTRGLFLHNSNAYINDNRIAYSVNGPMQLYNPNTGANSAMSFYTKAVERVRIDPSGNVGIGTNAPDTKLDVNGVLTLRESTQPAAAPDSGSSQIWMSDGNGAGNAGDIMVIINSGGTVKTNTLIDFSAL